MGYKINLTNSSHITRRLGEVAEHDEGKVMLSRHIYQTLGSLLKNKSILDDYNNGKLSHEYVRFLDKMDEINLGTADADALATDEVLGDLGEILDYSYSKDWIDVPNWLGEFDEYFGYRNIVSGSSNIVYGDKNITYTQGYTNG